MGFLDKAKQMAEQAQSKLDEVQKQFNESQSGSKASEGPQTEYDQHGRATPPHGDPLGEQAPAPPPPAPPAAATPDPAAPPTTPSSDLAADDEDPYAPPKLTGGDPLR
jgi:hypothetical protein